MPFSNLFSAHIIDLFLISFQSSLSFHLTSSHHCSYVSVARATRRVHPDGPVLPVLTASECLVWHSKHQPDRVVPKNECLAIVLLLHLNNTCNPPLSPIQFIFVVLCLTCFILLLLYLSPEYINHPYQCLPNPQDQGRNPQRITSRVLRNSPTTTTAPPTQPRSWLSSSVSYIYETAHYQMATVSIAQSPHSLAAMSSRRVPLGSNPNAANSPYRGMGAGAQKQKRSYATIQREEPYGQAPPAKRQMIETSIKSPSRITAVRESEGRVFTRRTGNTQTTAFEKKLEAARVRPSQQQTVQRAERHPEENLETIRQWQKHYRKVFPKFVFYFESVPEEARIRYTRQLAQLGAVSGHVTMDVLCRY